MSAPARRPSVAATGAATAATSAVASDWQQQQDYWGQAADQQQQYQPEQYDPQNYYNYPEAYAAGYPQGYEQYPGYPGYPGYQEVYEPLPAEMAGKSRFSMFEDWRVLIICFGWIVVFAGTIAIIMLIIAQLSWAATERTTFEGDDLPSDNKSSRAALTRAGSTVGTGTPSGQPSPTMPATVILSGLHVPAPEPAPLHPRRYLTNEEAPMRRFPLICVFGSSTNRSVVFPEDGLCEFTFYEGLYGPGQEGLDRVARNGGRERVATMARFLSQASSHTKTQYGLSFDYGGRKQALRDVQSKRGRARLGELWKSRIHHYGFLNIDFASFDVSQFRVAITCLSVLKPVTQQLRRSQSDTAYLGIGFYAEAGMHSQVLQVLRSVYMPSFIIAHGHMSSDDRRLGTACKIMPPTIPDGTGPYEISQASALHMLKNLDRYGSVLAISVAMFGRKYRPLDDRAFEPGEQCTNYRGTNYLVTEAELCQGEAFEQRLARNIPYRTTFVHDSRGPWTVTFDTETDLREKLCEAKSHHVGLKYGVAVYGAEYSAYTDDCPVFSTSGAYPRLRALKKVRDFFERNFSSTTQLASCKEVSF